MSRSTDVTLDMEAAMLRSFTLLLAFLLPLLVSGCGETQMVVYSTTINNPPDMEQPDDSVYGREQIACSSVAGVWQTLDSGQMAAGCSMRPITVLRERSTYEARNGRVYRIQEFRDGIFGTFYTFRGRLPNYVVQQHMNTDDIESYCLERFPGNRYREQVACMMALAQQRMRD